MTEYVLSLTGVAVRKGGRTILDIEKLQIARGEMFAIVGPNGAGKSTLLRVLAGLERPAGGEVRVLGQVLWRMEGRSGVLAVRRRMAMVFQEPLLLDTSVLRNVATGLAFRGAGRAVAEREARRWLDVFGIGHLENRYPHALSGGEAQRVTLARAFCCRPEVLLLDEPFAALDVPTRCTLVEDLRRVLAETATTVVFVTHDFEQLVAFGDRVVVLLDGRIAQAGTRDEVFNRPGSVAVASFLGVENIYPGRIVATGPGGISIRIGDATLLAAEHAGCELARLASGSVTACLRAEDVTVTPVADARSGAPAQRQENKLAGVITRIEPVAGGARVTVDCGIPVVGRLSRREALAGGWRAGARACVSFNPEAVHLIG